ncbi:hypothetical protein PF010_g28547 [Phytophthora fragariae]|uniref:Uncharacterized protein n=1 Tax=Phytophthora fragariae TaxID=53985 RepID=A0A6G0JQS8_9STRA|nr:hypothetical protein PF003_g27411 [Phytophthora fragariae]KAE9064584.1 hypothetical protein PF010_g28547 [Phytophthora fragariae]KAE9172898.1 hypothetical protein PF004_g27136 [Phytophthora fragariae]
MEELGPRQAELRLESHEVKRLIHEALSKKSFPPVVQYPEAARGDVLLSSLFQWPVIIWVPECVNPTKKPYCIMPECSCTSGQGVQTEDSRGRRQQVPPPVHQVSVRERQQELLFYGDD